MKLGILATDIGPSPLIEQYGSFADMFVKLFDQTDSGFEYTVYSVIDGVFPQDLDQYDGWIITGSVHGAYENLPWMQQLKTLIVQLHEEKRPTVGICFGHQIVAEALGGKVEKFDGGWCLGPHQYQLHGEHYFIPKEIEGFAINAVHQDQVIKKPEVSEVLASSDFCPNAGLIYGDHIITLQGHPEFSRQYEEALLSLKEGVNFPEDIKNDALSALKDQSLDSAAVAVWLAEFLKAGRV